jgi:hypothetical protein
MKRIVLAAVAFLALTACGSSDTVEGPIGVSDSVGMSAESVPMGAVDPGAQVITNGFLVLESDDPSQTSLQAQAIVAEANGNVERSAENRFDNTITITLGVRVPATSFSGVMDELSQLGTVNSKDISRTDVTTQVLDLDARIAALETSVGRMTELLKQAETVGDLIAAEAALAERQGQLDSLVSQRDYLRDQVEMSAISITMTGTSSSDDFASLLLLVGGIMIGAIIGVVIGATWWSRRRKL